MGSRTHDLVRIVFELPPDAWHGSVTERLWAEPLGDARYRLRNSPFFAFDVSSEDIVFGQERDGQIHFAGVSIRGGHSTYRIKVLSNEEAFHRNPASFLAFMQLACATILLRHL